MRMFHRSRNIRNVTRYASFIIFSLQMIFHGRSVRWTILPLYIDFKQVFLQQLNTRTRQDPRRENGLQKPPKCVAYPLFHLELDLTFFFMQSFLMIMDALKRRPRAKDQLYPILQELVTRYARFKDSQYWERRDRVISWQAITLKSIVYSRLCFGWQAVGLAVICHSF